MTRHNTTIGVYGNPQRGTSNGATHDLGLGLGLEGSGLGETSREQLGGGRGIEKLLERKEKVSWSGHRREFRYESPKDLGLGLG
jgi:hypothetical protein